MWSKRGCQAEELGESKEFQWALKKATAELRVQHVVDKDRHAQMALGTSSSHSPLPPPDDKARDTSDGGEPTFDAQIVPGMYLHPFVIQFLVYARDSASTFNWGWGCTTIRVFVVVFLFSSDALSKLKQACLGSVCVVICVMCCFI